MTIDELYQVRLSDIDGLPIKNKLPQDLKERLKTKNQWLEAGRTIKEGAKGYQMHSSAMSQKIFTYFLVDDTEPITAENVPRNCLTCELLTGHFCEIAGDYVGARNCCSAWQPSVHNNK